MRRQLFDLWPVILLLLLDAQQPLALSIVLGYRFLPFAVDVHGGLGVQCGCQRVRNWSWGLRKKRWSCQKQSTEENIGTILHRSES